MRPKTFDAAMTEFNDKVSAMDLPHSYKVELLSMISDIGFLHRQKSKRVKAEWLPLDGCMTICSNCHCLGCESPFCPNCGADMRIK